MAVAQLEERRPPKAEDASSNLASCARQNRRVEPGYDRTKEPRLRGLKIVQPSLSGGLA